jgi:hypothetical protein
MLTAAYHMLKDGTLTEPSTRTSAQTTSTTATKASRRNDLFTGSRPSIHRPDHIHGGLMEGLFLVRELTINPSYQPEVRRSPCGVLVFIVHSKLKNADMRLHRSDRKRLSFLNDNN